MSDHLSESELEAMTARVEQRLAELEEERPGTIMVSQGEDEEAQLVVTEIEPLEVNLDESAESFWQKFKRTARRDICEPGGKLYGMWRRVNVQKVVEYSALAISTMGVQRAALPSMATAVSVVMLHIGIRTLCEEYGD